MRDLEFIKAEIVQVTNIIDLCVLQQDHYVRQYHSTFDPRVEIMIECYDRYISDFNEDLESLVCDLCVLSGSRSF